MKYLKEIILTTSIVLFTACGDTGTTQEVTDDRFDMWEYMTATVDYEVEYALYKDGEREDYYLEKHQMFKDLYKRESATGVTTLTLHKREIIMKEPSREVTIERYLHIGDNNVFTSNSIKNCKLENFYKTFTSKDERYDNVLRVSCMSNSGVEQDFFYGYNEGLVVIFENDHGAIKEWVKVDEKRI